MKKGITILLCLLFLFSCTSTKVKNTEKNKSKIYLAVAKDGTGDFDTIQGALDSIDSEKAGEIFIYIKKGVYNEKVFVTLDNVTFIGENRDETRIEYAVLRKEWRETNDSDWGAAPLNIEADDFTMLNMTVYNTYGDLNGGNRDHQFAIRLSKGTRTITKNCNIISSGGDTLALWDVNEGMSYHEDCLVEGYTDNICPRGWAFIANCKVVTKKVTAALWHDGSAFENEKLVVVNSQFEGADGYYLARRHRDGSFYLINCVFSENMADKPIFRVTYPDNPSKDKPNLWGDRNYFYNSYKKGGQSEWMKDNLKEAKGAPGVKDITPEWTFAGKWNPVEYLKSLESDIKKAQSR